jgi:ABC-2 type transport system ATP-binding protein
MTMTDTFAIEVEGLRMRYGKNDVLHDVSFQVRRGEVLALLGPNGAGKTSTIEILEGFRMRSAGRVEVLGVDPARGSEQWRARIGIVLQSWRDHPKWRVRELLSGVPVRALFDGADSSSLGCGRPAGSGGPDRAR